MDESIKKNSVIKKNKSYILLLTIGFIINLLFSVAASNNSFMISAIGALVIFVTSCLLNVRSNIFLMVFLLPNQRDIALSNIDFTLLNIIILIIFVKLLWDNTRIPLKLSMLSFLFIAYSFYTVARFESFFMTATVSKACILIITLGMLKQKILLNKELYYNLVKFLVFGCLSAGFIGLLLNFDIGISRFTAGVNNDPNIFGSILSFAIANLLVLFLLNFRKSTWYAPALLGLIFFGLLTQSRSFLLTTSIIVIIALLFQKSISKWLKFITIIMLIGLFSYVILNFLPDSNIAKVYMSLYDRIINPRNEDISGGRLDLWKEYSIFLLSNKEFLLFGIGNNFIDMGFVSVAHNMILDSIISYGVLGLGFAVFIYIYLWKAIKAEFINRKSKFIIISYIPLISMLIANSTLYSFISIGVILQFFISFICINVSCYENKEM